MIFLMSDEQEMTNSNAGNVCVILLRCWRCFSIYPIIHMNDPGVWFGRNSRIR